jgi:hypothetical protein
LQHSDERPPTSGRPSLLSIDQQAEADRNRILSSLEGGAGTTAPGKARRGKLPWIAATAVAVLALGAGSAVWLAGEGEKEIVLAGTAPLPSTAAPAAPLASEPAVAVPAADEVSTAAILEDVPVVVSKEALAAEKKQATDAMNKLLAPTPAPRVAAKPAVKKLPVVAKAAPAHAAPHPAAPAQPTAMASNIAPVITKKGAAHAKATPADTDVALLAALVAHSKATQQKRPTGAAAKLQQCKTLGSVAEAEQCRARLCAGSAKNEAECKAPSLAKASADS